MVYLFLILNVGCFITIKTTIKLIEILFEFKIWPNTPPQNQLLPGKIVFRLWHLKYANK